MKLEHKGYSCDIRFGYIIRQSDGKIGHLPTRSGLEHVRAIFNTNSRNQKQAFKAWLARHEYCLFFY